MTGGAPSTRGWLGTATPAPAPEIAEADANLPPTQHRLVLESANAQGYVLRAETQEAGIFYARTYPRRAWNEWHYIFLAAGQRMKAAPVLDASGAIAGANVEFTRAPAEN